MYYLNDRYGRYYDRSHTKRYYANIVKAQLIIVICTFYRIILSGRNQTYNLRIFIIKCRNIFDIEIVT